MLWFWHMYLHITYGTDTCYLQVTCGTDSCTCRLLTCLDLQGFVISGIIPVFVLIIDCWSVDVSVYSYNQFSLGIFLDYLQWNETGSELWFICHSVSCGYFSFSVCKIKLSFMRIHPDYVLHGWLDVKNPLSVYHTNSSQVRLIEVKASCSCWKISLCVSFALVFLWCSFRTGMHNDSAEPMCLLNFSSSSSISSFRRPRQWLAWIPLSSSGPPGYRKASPSGGSRLSMFSVTLIHFQRHCDMGKIELKVVFSQQFVKKMFVQGLC